MDIGSGIGRTAVPLTKFLNPDARYEGFDVVKKGVKWCNAKIKTVNKIENQVDEMDISDINADHSPIALKTIELNQRQIHLIKKTLIPIKEFVTRIEREKFGFIQEKHIKYFYELKDLCLSLIDDCEQIEISHTNLFSSVQSHRINQIMKTLTVVATIFIPLTFVAGIYGMNFTNMSELNWKWGYAGV